MDNNVLRYSNGNQVVRREQLELVVPKKKVSEVYQWFNEHFITSSRSDYLSRCPYIVFQGPTGCGKTSTLKCIANDLKIPIREYGETIDTTALSYSIASIFRDETNEESHDKTRSLDRKRAAKFELFVIDSIRYNPLCNNLLAVPYEGDEMDDSEDEFDSDFIMGEPKPIHKPKQRHVDPGIIIHIETPLAFSRTQRVLLQSLFRLLKAIREISRLHPRRVAIVFEMNECERGTISLPTKVRLNLGVQVFKFNPITRANMKKFVEVQLRHHHNLTIDRDSVDLLVNDSDGDLRACSNTLQLLTTKTTGSQVNKFFSLHNNNDLQPQQNNKKQKLHHQQQYLKLKTNLMRDITRSFSFFHVLGKIFYQKRLYPELNFTNTHKYRTIDRPYPPENSTEYLADRLDVDPGKLLPWLHNHYHQFCLDDNIERAAVYMEHLTDVDSISINSTQSSQFYEMHHSLDLLQIYLAIESTVFTLYKDQTTMISKAAPKKMANIGQGKTLKSSVERRPSTSNGGELFSFSKPVSIGLHRLITDYQCLLEHFTSRVTRISSNQVDATKMLIDYVPYLYQMLSSLESKLNTQTNKSNGHGSSSPLLEDQEVAKLIRILNHIDTDSKVEQETRHERLTEILEELETSQSKIITSST